MTVQRAALAAFCSAHRIKLVHIWQTLDRWNAMVEWPYDPTKPKMATERHATGKGNDPVEAVLAGLDHLGHGRVEIRLFLLAYMLGMK